MYGERTGKMAGKNRGIIAVLSANLGLLSEQSLFRGKSPIFSELFCVWLFFFQPKTI
jgi:hypothetical protein